MILQYLSGPLIGAVIGYCTNFIAVKMLFFPRREIRIAGHRLPFTPGAIPKGQPRLAKAAGDVVGKTLLTGEDIKAKLLDDEMENRMASAAAELLDKGLKESVVELSGSDEEAYDRAKERASQILSDKVVEAMTEMQIGKLIAEKGAEVLMEKVQGTMLAMFLSGDAIDMFAGQIGEEIQKILEAKAGEHLQPVMLCQMDKLEGRSAAELLAQLEISQEKQGQMVKALYENLVAKEADNLISSLDVSGIVEEKISRMDVGELERLVLSVMKKELDTIVGLGAVVGFLLGLVNLLF